MNQKNSKCFYHIFLRGKDLVHQGVNICMKYLGYMIMNSMRSYVQELKDPSSILINAHKYSLDAYIGNI
jgi:hypothetical protein